MSEARIKWIPTAIRRELKAMPCAVCGTPYRIKCDHIIPWSKGGRSVRENLQPLCHECNHHKHNRRSNAELVAWVRSRGLRHFLVSVFEEDTRHINIFDRPWFQQWPIITFNCRPELVSRAHELHADFLRKNNELL